MFPMMTSSGLSSEERMNVPSRTSRQEMNQSDPQIALQQCLGDGGGSVSKMQGMLDSGGVTDQDLLIAREMIREKITQYLLTHQPTSRLQTRIPNIANFVGHIDDVLFNNAASKEVYINLDTLEARLQALVKSRANQLKAHCGSSYTPTNMTTPTPGSSTMIPTLGMPHGGTYSVDKLVNASSSPGMLMEIPAGSGRNLEASNRASLIGYTGAFIGCDVPSTVLSDISRRMIPTPGLKNTQAMSKSSSSGEGAHFGIESTVLSQQQCQKQFVRNQSSRIKENHGIQLGIGLGSNMQKIYGSSNGVAHFGNEKQLMNESLVSDGFLDASASSNFSELKKQHFGLQHHQSLQPRNGYGVNSITGTGNWYLCAPAFSTVNDLHHLNRSEATCAPPNYKRYLHMTHQTLEKPLYADCSQDLEFQLTKNLLQIPQQLHDNQLFAQFVQHQHHFINTDPIRQPMQVHGAESIEKYFPQAEGMSDLRELPDYNHNNMVDDNSTGTSVIGQFSTSQNLQPSASQNSQFLPQEFDPNQRAVESRNTLGSLCNGHQSEVLQGQCSLQAPEEPHVQGQTLLHPIQNDYQKQPITQADGGQQSHFSLDEPCSAASVANVVSTEGEKTSVVSSTKSVTLCSTKHHNQQRWLLFLHHAHHCPTPRGKCREYSCATGKDLWQHMEKCNVEDCVQPYCRRSKCLIKHYLICHTANCPVCIPVRDIIALKCKLPSDARNFYEANGSWKTTDTADADKHVPKSSSSFIGTFEEPLSKRLKVGHPSSKGEIYSISSQQAQTQACQQVDLGISMNSEITNTKLETDMNSEVGRSSNLKRGKINDSENKISAPGGCQPKPEKTQMDRYFNEPKVKTKEEATSHSLNLISGIKSGKPKIQGISLTELFTPEQVKVHINGLRQWVGQTKAKAKKNQPMKQSMGGNSCQLCAVEKFAFESPPMYCSICGARIKNNAIYYTYGNSDTRLYLCNPCHRGARGDTVKVDDLLLLKEKFQKKKNNEKAEEWWVQCDKCEAWQHQICALFNGRRNEGGQAEYTCPNCYALEVERGERKPLAPNFILGAEDLPKTLLSDHLEQRLCRKLKQERHDRARLHGKSFDEVPGVESLVVRVVSSVDKKLDVKPQFLEIFHEDKYPKVFPYKSKVVLLFQKIEGVEVCLFGMYVQEFGSECEFPNQRRVYLSYLDSVKYFRPEVKTVNGEALRTFVYHEILIGYLEYCKKRGFTSCYIWACPPLKGEDYILYCHPEIQKTPKSVKLREWYLQMLHKAKKENIVVDLTNVYDHFFVTSGECKAKVTAARLPYFDGDYWPGAAEDMVNMLQQEENAWKQKEKGEIKESITRRTLKAAGQTDLSGNASKDVLLMQKLGETISPLKEDFIMVHLQHSCSHCCLLMVSGNRWLCSQCGNFQLCDRCYITEQEREEKDRHPNTRMEKHQLYPVQITDVPPDTKDRDGIIESEFFDTRQAFLSLCQGNHYQYDTLRRAKHSSMMLLYHLHNPTAPAFVATCNACHHDIEAGQGWHCDVCVDFDMCNICYMKDGSLDHPHKLTNQQLVFDAQNTEARKKRVLKLRKMLDLLVHASKCRAPESLHCKNPDCLKVKRVFHHAKLCEVRAGGGCQVCRKMWSLLRFHAQGCKELVCCVPRCRDLKENFVRLQKQSDSRRRAAVKKMMRQRAAEVAGNS